MPTIFPWNWQAVWNDRSILRPGTANNDMNEGYRHGGEAVAGVNVPVNLGQIRTLLLPGLYQIGGLGYETDLLIDHAEDAVLLRAVRGDGHTIEMRIVRGDNYIQSFYDFRNVCTRDALPAPIPTAEPKAKEKTYSAAETRAWKLLASHLTQLQRAQLEELRTSRPSANRGNCSAL